MLKTTTSWTLFTDGGSRGNPGPAAYAFVLIDPSGGIYQESECLGRMTNNQAEYLALFNGMEAALALEVASLHVKSDSELMVRQMRGEYQVKNADLKEIFLRAKTLQAGFPGGVRFEHVRREKNTRSDELCNQAMDGKPSPRLRGPELRDAIIRVSPAALAKASGIESSTEPTASGKAKAITTKAAKPEGSAPFPAALLAILQDGLAGAGRGEAPTAEQLAARLAPWLTIKK